jgi:threonine dehydrogenase-like Zn-dependent dehydrogenase
VQGVEFPLPAGAPGHETWGEVVAVGSGVDSLRAGQLVTGLMGNGFAELGVAWADHLVAIDAPVLGEPLACAANVVHRAGIGPGQRVAIVGFGYLAALIGQLLPEAIAEWIAVSRRDDSRALALQLGAAAAYDFSDVPSSAWDSFPVVIEAAGVQQTLDFATWLTAERGRLVIAGYHADAPRSVNMQSWNWKGIDVINAHERDPAVYMRGLRAGLALAAERRLRLDTLITHRVQLAHIGEAFALMESRPSGFVKAVVQA